MKIGIYGGSFNPPHLSHMKIVYELLNKGYLDKIIIVPVGNCYEKSELISFEDRYNMLTLLFDRTNTEVSDVENQDRQIYTYQTLDYFKDIYPDDEIYFVTGADNINQIQSWNRYEYILANYKILVIPRNEKTSITHQSIIYTDIDVKPISSSLIRNSDYNSLDDYLDIKIKKYVEKKHLYDNI